MIDGEDVDDESSSSSDGSFSDHDCGDDDESEPEEDDAAAIDWDLPLYPGAPLSLGESMVAILLFDTRHKLSIVCISDLLRLIFVHCLLPNRCVKTYYRFKKFFDKTITPLTRHYYCTKCHKTFNSQMSHCEDCGCNSVSYFIEIPIIKQLIKLYSRPGFFNNLQRRFAQQNQNQNSFRDIYDGEIYKSLSGFLSNIFNISFTWFTDGVSIFKSSKFSIWPFYLIINELPFTHRFKKENMIFAGFWFGQEKPQANLFMSKFVDSIQKLYRGVKLFIRDLGTVEEIKAMIICGTCDLPAKALFLNMVQYNGKYGCQKCKIESEKVDNTRVHRYKNYLPLRTLQETILYAQQAALGHKPVMGVKGHTSVRTICLDYIKFTAIDDMHAAYLGTVKKIITLLFDSNYKNCIFSLYKYLQLIDKRIKTSHYLHGSNEFRKNFPRSNIGKLMNLKHFYIIIPYQYYTTSCQKIISITICS